MLALLVLTTQASPVPTVREEVAPPAPTGFALAAELFDDDRIPELEVVLSAAARDALRAEPYAWTEGALVYRGVRLEPVAIRLTGDDQSIDDKPSLRIELDRLVPLELLGLDALTLDSLSTDPSMMAERVAYRLFREQGIPASRANHALVRIDGLDRGLYTVVEDVTAPLLELWGLDPGGALWELDDGEFDALHLDRFEPVSGSADPAALEIIADALAAPAGDPVAATAASIDWAAFVDFAAATVVVGQYDGYPWRSPGDDVFVAFDAAGEAMRALPHALDETFRSDSQDPLAPPGLLLRACLDSPACAADYEASIWDAQGTSERFDLAGYARDVQARIAPLAALDPARPYTLEEVTAAQDALVDFVVARPDRLSAWLGGQ